MELPARIRTYRLRRAYPMTAVGLITTLSTSASEKWRAIGNAIFAASGARVRHLPVRPQAVLAALALEIDP
jgi:CO/xanthine dehydrogenase Mo-binding subunit